MLHEFLRAHRMELTARCQAKVTKRSSSATSTAAELERGVPVLIDQLIQILSAEQPDPTAGRTSESDAFSADISSG